MQHSWLDQSSRSYKMPSPFLGDNAWNSKLNNLVTTITFPLNHVIILMNTFAFPLNLKTNPWITEIIFWHSQVFINNYQLSQPHFGQVWGWNSHSQSWGLGVLRDSRMFRARQQVEKHLAFGCSWCHCKGLEA
jgi:hypothetical protein